MRTLAASGMSPVGQAAWSNNVVDDTMFLLSDAPRRVTDASVLIDSGMQGARIPPGSP